MVRSLREHLQKTCIPWRMLGWLFLLNIVLIAWYIIRPVRAFSGELSNYIYSGVIALYPLLIAILCFRNAPNPFNQRYKALGLRRFSPALLGVGMLAFLVGGIIQASIVALTHQLPHFTSPAFPIEWLAYPFLICAVLFLPAKNISHLLRIRILLDSLSIMVAVVTLGYYFVMAPLIYYGHGTALEKTIAAISPLPDVVLMVCLLWVALRSGERALRPVLIMLALSEIVIFTHDLILLEDLLNHMYNPLSLVRLVLFPALALVAGAAQTTSCLLKKDMAQKTAVAEQRVGVITRDIAYRASNWKAFVAPALVLLFCAFILSIWLRGPRQAFSGQIDIVYLGAFVVLILMVLRQFLMLYEIGTLQRKLQHQNRLLDRFNMWLKRQATTDALTRLPNHRMLVEQLDKHLAQAQESGCVCAVIFTDIDHFKSINDRYGHAEGDEVLRSFGALVKACLRATDCIGRWGGEEFVAILPDTDALEALNLAEHVRKMVEEKILAGAGELNVTCSLGIACYPHDATEREKLLARADHAMYAAKRLGRNQVRIANESEVLELQLPI